MGKLNIMVMDDSQKQKSIKYARILLTFGGLATLFIMQGVIWLGVVFGFFGLMILSQEKD